MTNKTILLIDDDSAVLGVLRDCLRPHYQVRIATEGHEGLKMARLSPQPDLILLDVRLPDLSGHELCARLKNDRLTAPIPVIFLSSDSDVSQVTHGLELGAVDYVTKPVAPSIVRARVQTHLRLRDQSLNLEALVEERTRDLQARTAELLQSQELAIVALGSLAETRDHETGNHVRRTQGYVEVMARRLARLPCYRSTVSSQQWAMMWRSAPLHDLGKVGIPDHILLKPGKLTAEEILIMQKHPKIGHDALRSAESRTQVEDSFLDVAAQIAYGHHERWDGGGYPQGLAEEAIPLPARLMAVADVYDALISKRVYKPAMTHTEAVEIIREGRARHFDPQIADCFLDCHEEFHTITQRFADPQPDPGPTPTP
ncbi:MAG: response regulator [Rhodocyclaceae bacterium]|jgi:putative two-component system response regulator|nr:response regulator [Rhodocyclaceae bacterium]